jgi:hypothetical protein
MSSLLIIILSSAFYPIFRHFQSEIILALAVSVGPTLTPLRLYALGTSLAIDHTASYFTPCGGCLRDVGNALKVLRNIKHNFPLKVGRH